MCYQSHEMMQMLQEMLHDTAMQGDQTMELMTQDDVKQSKEELKEILISLLDSQDVQDKIRAIAAGLFRQQDLQRDSELEKACERLNAELAAQEALTKEWSERAERAEDQAKELKEQVQFAENQAEEWKERAQQSEKHSEHYIEQARQLKNQIEKWQTEAERAREQSEGLRAQLEQEQQSVKLERQNAEYWKTQMEQWKNEAEVQRLKLMDIGRAAALYGELSQSSQHALENIFRSTKPELFIASGVQIDNLKQLWEFAKSEIMEGRVGETELLADLIGYFMNLYNLIHGRMIYVKIEAKAGMDFDVDWHIRTSGSRPAGKIGRVYLDGYVNVNNGSIFGKSVVQVG